MSLAAEQLRSPDANEHSFHAATLALKTVRNHLLSVAPSKEIQVNATLAAFLSSGHVLMEDVPGIGKTTFVKATAKLLGLPMKRMQFTNDVLPSDVLGAEVYNPQTQSFVFHRGPIFANILVADELNRASPRTQSALLEAMGEGFVTVAGRPEKLPTPFLVIATQNPHEHLGTYPLPESQLDRFAAKFRLEYPTREQEERVFKLASLDPIESIPSAVITESDIDTAKSLLETVTVTDRLVTYAKRFVDRSRHDDRLDVGISTRAGVSWIRMAKALAMLHGRNYVIPDDLKGLAKVCLAHRVIPRGNFNPESVIAELLENVPVD